MKIEVEGAPAEVLRGSEKVLARARPVLTCETQWLESWSKFPRHLPAPSDLELVEYQSKS